MSRKIEIVGINDAYWDLIDDPHRLQILFGGSSSGKSVFKAQDVVISLLGGERNWLCCRNVAKTIRTSIYNEIIKEIHRQNVADLFRVHQSDMTITCRANDCQALMHGLDNVEKIKSITPKKGVITDIWIEEATETKQSDVKQLEKRLRGRASVKKRIHLTFNPILRTHWIYQTYFAGKFSDDDTRYEDENTVIVKTTYKDNRFLEPDDIRALEDESDEYFYAVYTLGNWGVLGDLIFTNWRVANVNDDPIFETFDIFKNGLDFGYSNDPTALNRMYYHRATKKLYIVDEYNQKEVTNDIIASDIKKIIGNDLVVCDSAEPKSIQELCNYGINAVGAIKGKDSVLHGIQWLKQQEIIIDRQCQNTVNNFQLYHWRKDKDGNVLNAPVDRHNDHIDAIRYSMEGDMLDIDDSVIGIGRTMASQADW